MQVEIVDVNDRHPQFTRDQYTFSVLENQPPGTDVGRVVAIDMDSGPHGHVVYSVVTSSEWFVVNHQSGMIQTARELDRETQHIHHVTVVASDLGVPPISTSCDVIIQVFHADTVY